MRLYGIMNIPKLFISIFFFLLSLWTCNARPQKLKVISFNVKVDSKADGVNQWENRKPLVMKFLSKEDPDILCLQEVLHRQLNELKAYSSKYEVVGLPRVDGKSKGDFIPIFYRKDKFECIDSGTFWLSETPDSIGTIGWDAKYPRTATWINLRVVKTGEIIFVLNTHLDNIGKVARKNGIKLILNQISVLSKSDSIILTGDLNDVASSNVHKIVAQGELYDTYQECRRIKGVNYTIHQFGQRDIGKRYKIDYVFTSKDFKVVSVNIPKERSKDGVYLSDHNPIIVKLKL